MPGMRKPNSGEKGQAESSMTLLQRVQAGDGQALDALVARYRPRLVRWASGRLPARARDLTETQDLVQETLLSAFRKIETLEIGGEGALQAYLRQALLNRIRMEIRRAGRKPPGEELPEALEAGDASPLEKAIGAQAVAGYERAERKISLQRFCELANFYGVEPERLLSEALHPNDPDLVVDLTPFEEPALSSDR